VSNSLAEEPVPTPSKQQNAQAEINWLPLRALHSYRQKGIHQESNSGKGPGPASQPYLIYPRCPEDRAHGNDKSEHYVKTIGILAKRCHEQQDRADYRKRNFLKSSTIQSGTLRLNPPLWY
jgi:hypothetical protein